MVRAHRYWFWISLAISAICNGATIAYLGARLYSALPLVGGLRRLNLTIVFVVLAGVSLSLLVPFAFKRLFIGVRSLIPVACAIASLIWLVVGPVLGLVAGL